NGEVFPAKTTETNVTARVPVRPGKNSIRVALANQWRATSTTEELIVSYLRPPRVLKFAGPTTSDVPLVELVAQAESELPLTPQSVLAEVNGRKVAQSEVIPDGQEK